ncbi:MAG: type II secretion system protein [Candidatus Rokuibacteriota bacterium]
MNQRGFGYIEIALVLVVVAASGYVLVQYFASTTKAVEQMQEDRPLARARIIADRSTLQALQLAIRNYQAEHGKMPPDKATVLGLLMAPPKFQCPGNDFEYDMASGDVRLTITDDARCG